MNASDENALFQRIHLALPQTQCTRCGYPDCAAYARAIAAGHAPINQCPPGGAQGVQRLAHITGQAAQPLNPAHGLESPRAVALIDEAWCIGCTRCIQACPVDAILGSHKLMHTVIEPYCTGCELCVPVCPVDCISLENVTGTRTGWNAWSQPEADTARSRYEARSFRSRRAKDKPAQASAEMPPAIEAAKAPEIAEKTPQLPDPQPDAGASSPAERKRAMIEAALARARAQRERKT